MLFLERNIRQAGYSVKHSAKPSVNRFSNDQNGFYDIFLEFTTSI